MTGELMQEEIDFNRTCDSCGYCRPVDLKVYNLSRRGNVDINAKLCGICATTTISGQMEYPLSHTHDGEMLRSMAWIGNAILVRLESIEQRLKRIEKNLGVYDRELTQ